MLKEIHYTDLWGHQRSKHFLNFLLYSPFPKEQKCFDKGRLQELFAFISNFIMVGKIPEDRGFRKDSVMTSAYIYMKTNQLDVFEPLKLNNVNYLAMNSVNQLVFKTHNRTYSDCSTLILNITLIIIQRSFYGLGWKYHVIQSTEGPTKPKFTFAICFV